MTIKLVISIVLMASTLPAAVQAQVRVGPQVPLPTSIEVPPDGVTVPMQDMGGRPVVELKINGKGPYRFILDSGAVTTVVSDELSRELFLTPPAGVQVASVGGGAEQDPILPGRTHIKVPEGYPQDQYWKGEAPKEDYNYLHVEVTPGQPTKFTLNRFRPWSAEPFATVELFK